MSIGEWSFTESVYKNQIIRTDFQFKSIEKQLSKDNICKKGLTIIGGSTDISKPLLLASSFFLTAIEKSFSAKWHCLIGGKRDILRDLKLENNSVSNFNIIVLSNIFENSTYDKIEKIQDLIALYTNASIIIVIMGVDPLVWSRNSLYRRPNFIYYFNDRLHKIKEFEM